jgi:hypothetical protein
LAAGSCGELRLSACERNPLASKRPDGDRVRVHWPRDLASAALRHHPSFAGIFARNLCIRLVLAWINGGFSPLPRIKKDMRTTAVAHAVTIRRAAKSLQEFTAVRQSQFGMASRTSGKPSCIVLGYFSAATERLTHCAIRPR